MHCKMCPVTIKLEDRCFFAVFQSLPTTLFIQACFSTFFQDAPFSNFLQKLSAGLTDFDNSPLVPASQLELISSTSSESITSENWLLQWLYHVASETLPRGGGSEQREESKTHRSTNSGRWKSLFIVAWNKGCEEYIRISTAFFWNWSKIA